MSETLHTNDREISEDGALRLTSAAERYARKQGQVDEIDRTWSKSGYSLTGFLFMHDDPARAARALVLEGLVSGKDPRVVALQDACEPKAFAELGTIEGLRLRSAETAKQISSVSRDRETLVMLAGLRRAITAGRVDYRAAASAFDRVVDRGLASGEKAVVDQASRIYANVVHVGVSEMSRGLGRPVESRKVREGAEL